MSLNVNQINKIIELHQQGLSIRQISKKTRKDKNTVSKYIRIYGNQQGQPLIPATEKNYEVEIPTSWPSQMRNESLRQQAPQYYSINQDPWYSEQQYREIDQEYKIREREKEKEEQARKSNQEAREKLHQLEIKFCSMQQEKKRQEQQKTRDFLQKLHQEELEFKKEQSKKAVELNLKLMARVRDIKEEMILKEKHDQQLIDSIPRRVRKEMNNFQVLQQAHEDEIQRDKDEDLEPTFTPLNQAEEDVNTESDYSDNLEGFILGGIPVVCKIINFYLSPDNNIPINSPEYWIRLSKYLKDGRKREA